MGTGCRGARKEYGLETHADLRLQRMAGEQCRSDIHLPQPAHGEGDRCQEPEEDREAQDEAGTPGPLREAEESERGGAERAGALDAEKRPTGIEANRERRSRRETSRWRPRPAARRTP